jgi:hypothetical protein
VSTVTAPANRCIATPSKYPFRAASPTGRGCASASSPLKPDRSASKSALRSQLDFLGVLFIVWGLLTALVGVSTLALGVGAFAIILSSSRNAQGGNVAAGLTAAIFTTLAVIAIVWGAAHVAAGVPLRKRKPWARMLALGLGSVDLLLLPYGTALGIYALYVLLSESGKTLFTSMADG